MTIAGKINVLVISLALLLGTVVTGYTAVREYRAGLDRVVATAEALVLSRPDLQVAIYQGDVAVLEQVLDEFLATPAVFSAAVRNSVADVLVRRGGGEDPAAALSFNQLRGAAMAMETSLLSLDEAQQPAGAGLWSALTEPRSVLYLTIPVFTAVNPVARDLESYDFFLAPALPAAGVSLRIIGYIQLAIDKGTLLDTVWPIVAPLFYGCLLLLALCAAAAFVVGRGISAGLLQLSRLADDVAAGQLVKPVEIKASSELREIATVLNSVIGGFSNFRKETDIGHRLLNRKVEERNTQLSEREEELGRAAEEINETRSQLQHLAYYDSLTTLPNRRLFTEQLGLLLDLNQRHGHTLALLFLNLDNFKRINDSLGHAAGDLALQEVAKRLSRNVRDSDRVAHNVETDPQIDVARLGGDEFTVVLNQLENVEAAGLVARRLVTALLEPMVIEGHEVVVTPSIGIAIAPADGRDVEALLRVAGIAMHHAKASTRDSFLFYRGDMDAIGVGRLKLEADLRKAVERDELVLHYQPQVNTLNGSVAGAEALLRWAHPERGMVSPQQFISLAEEIGVIGQLGDWVLGEACRQLREFDSAGLKLPRVAINVSAFQFNSAFVDKVKAVLQRFKLTPSRLELGLTEGILMDPDVAVSQCLHGLKELGVHLSVDDFGTSYSPLTYLGRYAPDELRIDRSFVRDCEKSERSARLVSAIIAMAKSLDVGIVAEGVETEGQYRFLIEQGANVIQGYFFSPPVPAAELAPMLAPWHFVEQVQSIQG